MGKAIDRSFVADYDSTSREEVFASPQAQTMVNEIILQVKNEQETIWSFIKQKTPYQDARQTKYLGVNSFSFSCNDILWEPILLVHESNCILQTVEKKLWTWLF